MYETLYFFLGMTYVGCLYIRICKGRSWFLSVVLVVCLINSFLHSAWPCLVLNYMVTSVTSQLNALDLFIFNKIMSLSLHFPGSH